MSIVASCPGCSRTIQVPDDAAGKKGKCRACGSVVIVPDMPGRAKTCTVCGVDVSKQKRTKDEAGNYFCQPCWMLRCQRRGGREEPHSDVGSQDHEDAGGKSGPRVVINSVIPPPTDRPAPDVFGRLLAAGLGVGIFLLTFWMTRNPWVLIPAGLVSFCFVLASVLPHTLDQTAEGTATEAAPGEENSEISPPLSKPMANTHARGGGHAHAAKSMGGTPAGPPPVVVPLLSIFDYTVRDCLNGMVHVFDSAELTLDEGAEFEVQMFLYREIDRAILRCEGLRGEPQQLIEAAFYEHITGQPAAGRYEDPDSLWMERFLRYSSVHYDMVVGTGTGDMPLRVLFNLLLARTRSYSSVVNADGGRTLTDDARVLLFQKMAAVDVFVVTSFRAAVAEVFTSDLDDLRSLGEEEVLRRMMTGGAKGQLAVMQTAADVAGHEPPVDGTYN